MTSQSDAPDWSDTLSEQPLSVDELMGMPNQNTQRVSFAPSSFVQVYNQKFKTEQDAKQRHLNDAKNYFLGRVLNNIIKNVPIEYSKGHKSILIGSFAKWKRSVDENGVQVIVNHERTNHQLFSGNYYPVVETLPGPLEQPLITLEVLCKTYGFIDDIRKLRPCVYIEGKKFILDLDDKSIFDIYYQWTHNREHLPYFGIWIYVLNGYKNRN